MAASEEIFMESRGKDTVEKIYQKKTPIEHVLLRPDTYIGSVEPQEQDMWVWDGEETGLTYRKVNYVPGLYKIFDEILVNAADNKQRDPSMDCLRVEINAEDYKISVYNNGKGIPVVEHKTEKMFVPTMIFGHLLTSSNYDDNEKRVTGGRHGYGAKLCNIFSTKFIVETSSREYKLAFKQVWTKNMSHTTDPKIVPATNDDFTRITFHPDLAKFNMDHLDKDIVAIFSRRVYDIAGSTKGGVKVYLNGKRLKVNSFKSYVELYLDGLKDENGEQIKFAYDDCSDRWQIAVAASDKGFQQVSFVNSIATTKGGRHVEHVLDQIVPKLNDAAKRKNKAKVDIKPHMIKSNVWLFVNCLIENPSFDSQTKENMTLQVKKFGSKCQPNDKFFNSLMKSSIVENIMSQAMAKADKVKESQGSSKKQSKILDIPKLEDANWAGRQHSLECTLILTEGDSAKSLVNSGFEIVGRDRYGVFPLKGKLLNVREANHKQIVENKEIQHLLKIIGLDYRKKYDSDSEIKSLRYGKLMIMTDQDQDGSHIKGLLINFIHHNWPNLIKKPFLEEFITPIVRAKKGKEIKSFYSLPEMQEWKQNTPDWKTWSLKYYKGLGTSDKLEAKEYFANLERHRIIFKYHGDEDDHSIILAFSKKMIEQRKDWLTNFMEDRKRRRDLGLPDTHLYSSRTNEISYRDFVNKELIHFSNLDNERSIPSLMDGLKPAQRKVLYACFRKNIVKETKVSQLGGAVSEMAAYHHGEASLYATIIGLAQNFVGSNNINLLVPAGLFGSRLAGGKDASAPRYLNTRLSSLTRKIFPPEDDPLLSYQWDDNSKVEPEYYVPIIPMVLVNGAEGIGTGWSTKIPNFDPREIIANIKRMLNGEQPFTMKPWFKGFRGSIDQVDPHRYLVSGEVARLEDNILEITELPIRTWTDPYKDNILIPMRKGTDKTSPMIEDFTNHCTDVSIRFVVTLGPENLRKAQELGIHKYFKLQNLLSTSSMVLFDSKGCLRKYDNPEDILKEFFEVRLDYYNRRKEYKKGLLQAETSKLTNQVRFILEKNDGSLKMENVKKKDLIETLKTRGYDSDPVKTWKEKTKLDEDDAEPANEQAPVQPTDAFDFNYLLSMSMQSMLMEHVDELIKIKDKKKTELEELIRTTIEDLWKRDLDEMLKELEKVEKSEAEQYDRILELAIAKEKHQGKGSKGRRKTGGIDVSQCKPTPGAEKIDPQVDQEVNRRRETMNNQRTNKTPKVKKEDEEPEKLENEDFDFLDIDDRPLSERIGISPAAVDSSRKLSLDKSDTVSTPKTTKTVKAKSEKKDSVNGSKSRTKPGSKDKKKKKNPWSDSEEEKDDSPEEIDDFSDDYQMEIVPKSPKQSRKVSKIKPSPPIEPLNSRNGDVVDQPTEAPLKTIDSDSDDSFLNAPAKVPPNRSSEDLFDTLFRTKPSSTSAEMPTPGPSSSYDPQSSAPSPATSIEEFSPVKKVTDSTESATKKPTQSKAKTPREPKKPQEKKSSSKRKKIVSSEDDEFDIPRPKKGGKAKTVSKKKDSLSSSETEAEDNLDINDVSNYVSSTRIGRNKKPINYKCDMSTDEDSDI